MDTDSPVAPWTQKYRLSERAVLTRYGVDDDQHPEFYRFNVAVVSVFNQCENAIEWVNELCFLHERWSELLSKLDHPPDPTIDLT